MDKAVLKDILDKQPRKKEIELARNLEAKTRYFTDPALNFTNSDIYKNQFLSVVQSRLNNPDSFNNFKNYLSFPLKINEFIESIYTKISNIWQGQNPYFDFTFKSESIEDYQEFVSLDFFKNDAWNEYKTHHNSIILTDLPEEQTQSRPEPFNYFIKINSVLDVVSDNNVIDHVIYILDDTPSKEILAVVDIDGYQLYDYKDKKLGEEILNAPHDLNRCPAEWLSRIDFNSKSNIIKSNVLSKSLGKIEDLQIIYTLKNILSPYAFYQFIVKYKNSSECDYDDGKYYCDGGYLKLKSTDDNQTDVNVYSNGVLTKCPLCNKTPGVGDVYGKPIPTSSDEPDLKNVIEFIAPNTKIMEYGDKYISSLESDLFDVIVGTDENLNPNENHNETAYKYNTEGQQDVIFRWKSMFESVISNTLDNVLQLRYGDLYESNSIDLGTDFILADLNTLYEEKKTLKEIGLDSVFDFNKTIINAKYQNNPQKRRRALIIDAFKPFDESIEKIEQSFSLGLVDKKDFIKQKYLSEFIKQFESTKLITDFNQDMSIGAIKKVLDGYFDTWYNDKFKEVELNNKNND